MGRAETIFTECPLDICAPQKTDKLFDQFPLTLVDILIDGHHFVFGDDRRPGADDLQILPPSFPGPEGLILISNERVPHTAAEDLQCLPGGAGHGDDVLLDSLEEFAGVSLPFTPGQTGTIDGQDGPLRSTGGRRIGMNDLNPLLRQVRKRLDSLRITPLFIFSSLKVD